MNEIWIDKYAPKSLEDYVGDQYQTILYYIDEFYKGKRNKGFLLYGLPGVGKSALINVIGNYYNADMYVINGSDDRNEIDINIINASSLLGKKRIIILEEIDGFNKQRFKELSIIIELSKHPIILICNDIKLIDNIVKLKCYLKEIVVDKFSLKSLANRIIKEENLDINKDKLNKDLVFIKSYRSLLDYLQFGYISEKGSFEINKKLFNLPTYTFDNSDETKIISIADIYLKKSQMGYKNGEKIAKYLLNSIKLNGDDHWKTYNLKKNSNSSKKPTAKIKILGFK